MRSNHTTSHSELRLRNLLAKVLPGSIPTYNHRPKWLRGCELDIHFQKEKIAFEFDGKQHREFTPEFHRTRSDFEAQLERDAFKRAKCSDRGIVVVTVTYENLSEDRLRNLLIVALEVQRGWFRRDREYIVKRGKSTTAGLRLMNRLRARQPFC